MAWDKTQPTNTTKIRNLGVVIRPNWEAIESADSTFQPQALNFTDRDVAGVPSNPVAITDAFILYCKTDSSGNSELFGINENSNVIQLTKGAPTVASAGRTFLPGGLIFAWGRDTKANDGTITVPGMTTLYQPVITIEDSSATPMSRAYVYNITGNMFRIKVPTGGNVVLRWHAIGV